MKQYKVYEDSMSKDDWNSDLSALNKIYRQLATEEKDQEYESGADALDRLEDERDLFEHIALTVMRALEENGQADFVLIKDRKVHEWWTGVKAKEEKERRAREAKERRERAISEALAKLSEEEKRLLGLIK